MLSMNANACAQAFILALTRPGTPHTTALDRCRIEDSNDTSETSEPRATMPMSGTDGHSAGNTFALLFSLASSLK